MIPLSVPDIRGNEWSYVKDCLDTGWISSVGAYVNRFENEVAAYAGASYGVSASNGTAALHVALRLAGVEQGDLVVVPNLTFVASVNAIKYLKAEPLLMDVDPETWQMDLDLLAQWLEENSVKKDGKLIHKTSSQRIAAIMPVHVLGNMCDMERLTLMAKTFDIPVVEDATEALGSFFKGRSAGTFGMFGCFSFNGNKIISTGGGGMIVTDDEGMAKKAKHLTTQAKSDSVEYIHDEVGYNYRLVNVLAAIGVAQLEGLPDVLRKKEEIAMGYVNALSSLKGVQFQKSHEDCKPNHWLFTIRIDQPGLLMKYLRGEGIESRKLWVPMNRLPFCKENIYRTTEDISGKLYDSCLSIPCSYSLSAQDQQKVIDTIRAFFRKG